MAKTKEEMLEQAKKEAEEYVKDRMAKWPEQVAKIRENMGAQ